MPPRKACDVCFKRKILCSIPKPGESCNWCSNQKIPCTFSRPPQKKRQSLISPESVHALSRRVEQLEADLARKNAESAIITGLGTPSDHSGHLRRTSESIAGSSCESPLDGGPTQGGVSRKLTHQQLGHNWYFRGMRILSQKGQQWMESKTGQTAPLSNHVALSPQSSLATGFGLAIFGAKKLPSKQMTQDLVDAYFTLSIQFCFPVLDHTLMSAMVEDAYSSPTPDEALHAQACVWALHTWTRFLLPLADIHTYIDPETCAAQCRSILEKIDWVPSLEALQAILLLIYQGAHLKPQNYRFLYAIACQMACDLGGHSSQPQDHAQSPLADCRRHHARALFALCYVVDKDCALRLGRPPLISEDYASMNFVDHLGDFPVDRRLSLIKDRTYRLLYSPKAEPCTDGEILHYIRQLDHDLEQWRLSIPASIRPRLSIPADFHPAMDERNICESMQLINLQLDYHYTLIAIHTMVRKCGAGDGKTELPEDLHSVIHSSVDLSLEAGQSTFMFLKIPLKLLGGQAFRYIQLYAPAAAMALFVDVLVHPFAESSQKDLEILIQSVGVFQSIPLDTLSSLETQQIQTLNEFIMELTRLASCAIWQAKTTEKGHHHH
ncbi:hypothetical protein NLG97_g3808 [Lecanicillium saksenae]|uniref:Uncharacterized protein n=1 Tax=Lecanicillium saksenae TaxID=468837 RepID=A0ACC1QYX3_9HYPO|nr:hypothetical protein NLG97_g3808 [Lecanicillium saksenae]